jgi:ribose transport system ATP-binding protein
MNADRKIEVRNDANPQSGSGFGALHDDGLLVIHEVSKKFGGTQAVDRVSLRLNAGEIVALLGENGAGKSTLIKILAGIHTVDSGSVFFRGREVTGNLRRLPIAFIHQDLGLIEWMTVAESVCLTLGYPQPYGIIDWGAARGQAHAALSILGADINPDLRIQDLSRTEKSLVAIARALAAEAQVLVLDEPTASLPTGEVAFLFAALRRLCERGIGMLYVSHRLDEVFVIADRMVVLRDGQVVGEREVAATRPDEAIRLIVGQEPSQVFRRPVQHLGSARLVLESVMVGAVGPVNCEIHAGEVVGLVGLRGGGQDVVGRVVFGLERVTSGRILLDGNSITPSSPAEAMSHGINFVSADRVGESVVPNLSVRENLFLNPVAAGVSLFSIIRPGSETRAAVDLGRRVSLRPNDPALSIELLSGGNQQKVVLGRWLNLNGKVYVFEDPTAGVDVGAKAEIYRLFDVALESGAAIIIVSTDFEEVAQICHRAFVFDRGHVVAEFTSADLSIQNLLAASSALIGPTTLSPINNNAT